MDKTAQIIAIAEQLGWRVECVMDEPLTYAIRPQIGTQHYYDSLDEVAEAFPDYLTDLNAMHEAEKVLTAEQAREYHKQLFKTCSLVCPWMWHTTAAQRAEAFLKTLNLWKDYASE